MVDRKAPVFYDDLEAFRLLGRGEFQAASTAVGGVTQALDKLLVSDPSAGVIPRRDDSAAEAELLTSLAEAILKTRMLTAFFEVMQLRLLRKVYQDGTQGSDRQAAPEGKTV